MKPKQDNKNTPNTPNIGKDDKDIRYMKGHKRPPDNTKTDKTLEDNLLRKRKKCNLWCNEL